MVAVSIPTVLARLAEPMQSDRSIPPLLHCSLVRGSLPPHLAGMGPFDEKLLLVCRCAWVVATAFLVAACHPETVDVRPNPMEPSGGLQVLFVGNSLTSTHDVPGRVRALAGADEEIAIDVLDISRSNYALMDHWAIGAVDVLGSRQWDVVVMQQGPSSLDSSRENLIEWTQRWTDAIAAHGSRAALYMVWPSRTRFFAFDAVSLSYRSAADSASIGLIPAGEAWLRAWEIDPDLQLYGPDDFHPSPTGATLAAISIYRGITGRMPNADAAASVGIARETFEVLVAAAATAQDVFGVEP